MSAAAPLLHDVSRLLEQAIARSHKARERLAQYAGARDNLRRLARESAENKNQRLIDDEEKTLLILGWESSQVRYFEEKARGALAELSAAVKVIVEAITTEQAKQWNLIGFHAEIAMIGMSLVTMASYEIDANRDGFLDREWHWDRFAQEMK